MDFTTFPKISETADDEVGSRRRNVVSTASRFRNIDFQNPYIKFNKSSFQKFHILNSTNHPSKISIY
jgi:hypothetical protein